MKAGGSASRPEAVNPHTSSSYRMNHSQHITSHKSMYHWNVWITSWITLCGEMYTVCYRTNKSLSMCCGSKHWSRGVIMKRLSGWLAVPTGGGVDIMLFSKALNPFLPQQSCSVMDFNMNNNLNVKLLLLTFTEPGRVCVLMGYFHASFWS